MKFKEILEIAKDSSFVHPAAKKVPATVHSAVYKKSSKGNHMIEVHFKVTGGPNAGKGRPVRHYLMLETDQGIQQINNLGVSMSVLEKQFGNVDIEQAGERLAGMLTGKRGAIDLDQETYNERLQNRVKWVNPVAGSTGPKAKPEPENEPNPDTAEEELADDYAESGEESELERLSRELEEAKAAAAKPQKARRSRAPIDEDELPF